MTPEQRDTLQRQMDSEAERFIDDLPSSIHAVLTLIDAQARGLADLRAFLALAARDDESGKAELGAAVQLGECIKAMCRWCRGGRQARKDGGRCLLDTRRS